MVRRILIRVMAFVVPILLDAFCMGLKKWYWNRQRQKRYLDYTDTHHLE